MSCSSYFLRFITIITAAGGETGPGTEAGAAEQESVDLKTLRAIRVLRPLKLVSGVPSKLFLQFKTPAKAPKFPFLKPIGVFTISLVGILLICSG